MSPTERLSTASQSLKAAAKRWADANDQDDRLERLQTLYNAARHYALMRADFETWLRALPPPKQPTPNGGH